MSNIKLQSDDFKVEISKDVFFYYEDGDTSIYLEWDDFLKLSRERAATLEHI